jgi:hypothetical protein
MGDDERMGHPAYATDFLVPDALFLVALVIALAVFAGLVLWPLVESVVRQQWGWVLGVVVLGPIGGLLWFAVGRRGTRASAPSP